ncbi:MAG: N-acetylglucosamine-6-phosphate deacetylase [Armatimonadetes bacterium]|nr:N-acetylglucosamine-6-phosphate deacetylase [Armatimonadota bacterium]
MGFDLQVNGYLGVGFSDPDLTAEACRATFRHYLTVADGFLPTVITSPESTYARNLPLLAGVMAEPEFTGRVPGLHLEGPFISPEPGAVGAHCPRSVRDPDLGLWRRLLDWSDGRVRLLTIAAERPGAESLCRAVTARGVVVALGHQLARYDDLVRLRDAGARLLTHLGNGMPNIVPRHDNSLLAGLAVDGLDPMLITDGHHLPAHVIKVIVDHVGAGRAIVTSDASRLAGLAAGEYRDGENRVVIEPDGKLWNPDIGCLVGSSAHLGQCADVLRALGLSEHAIQAMTDTNPRRALA